MAITPASLQSLSDNELAVVSRAETVIDNELRLKFEEGEPVYVRNALIRFVFNENERVLKTVKAAYVAAGWEVVEYQSEEGTWLSFTEA